ncbi:hypothetical protein EJB05_05851, partial [Eragrostis curvula]
MAGRWARDDNPFEEVDGDVNPFSHPRPTPLPPEPVGFYNDTEASVDIPLGTNKKDLKKKEKELLAKEAELNRREKIMYFVGFALFALEALLSIWVYQRVYRFFRGKGNEAPVRSDVAGAPPF